MLKYTFLLILAAAAVFMVVLACEPDQTYHGCKILGTTCSCGTGCRSEFIYRTRRACLNALRACNIPLLGIGLFPRVGEGSELNPPRCSNAGWRINSLIRVPNDRCQVYMTTTETDGLTCSPRHGGKSHKDCTNTHTTSKGVPMPVRGPHACEEYALKLYKIQGLLANVRVQDSTGSVVRELVQQLLNPG